MHTKDHRDSISWCTWKSPPKGSNISYVFHDHLEGRYRFDPFFKYLYSDQFRTVKSKPNHYLPLIGLLKCKGHDVVTLVRVVENVVSQTSQCWKLNQTQLYRPSSIVLYSICFNWKGSRIPFVILCNWQVNWLLVHQTWLVTQIGRAWTYTIVEDAACWAVVVTFGREESRAISIAVKMFSRTRVGSKEAGLYEKWHDTLGLTLIYSRVACHYVLSRDPFAFHATIISCNFKKYISSSCPTTIGKYRYRYRH